MKSKKQNWFIPLAILAIIIGLMNTVFIKHEDVGTWRNYVGYGFLLLAIVNTLLTIKHFLNKKIEK